MFHVKHSVLEYNVPRETLDRVRLAFDSNRDSLHKFVDELLFWNRKINLVSREINKDEVLKHIEHSLCIMYAPKWMDEGLRIIDAGSGGGLPGVPLAIVSNNTFVMIDLVLKKMMALSQIIKSLGLNNAQAFQEDLRHTNFVETDIVISKHAFKLEEFIKLTSNKSFKQAIFLKGEDFTKELNRCTEELRVEYIPLEKYHVDEFYKGKYVVILNNEKSGTSSKTDSLITDPK